MEFLTHLFDTTGFLPRWHCGDWTLAHGWLHILSDLGVWSAYVAIPCVLLFFLLRKRDLPFRLIFLLFGAFILACGTTHLMEVIIFWWPVYRLAGVIKLLTAIVSWGTVVALVPVVPKVLKLRSPDELEREIAARTAADLALQQANSQLQLQVEALQASEERFRLLVEGTKDYAIFLLDSTGHIASWNSGAERIKQYRAEEIIGEHFSRFYSAEDIAAGKPQRELAVAAAEGRCEDEGERIRKDGSRFFANVVITALRDAQGKLRGFSKITRDITERKVAEQNALRLVQEADARRAAEERAQIIQAEQERLRVTLASIGDAVISTDSEGRVTFLNPVAESLTGWTTAEASGVSLSEVFRIVNEETRRSVENPALRALREGVIVGLANHTILIGKDGSERPIDDSAAPIRDAKANTIGAVLVFRDITQRQRTERETAQLYRDLREADRRKDEFLAMLAHELRNPLAPIRSALAVMRRAGNDTQIAEESRGIVERQVVQMVRLVDDLLDVSRITRDKLELRKARVDLASVITNAVETASPAIEQAGHELTQEIPSVSIFLEADPTRLAQVFANLLGNSARYTPPGGRIWLSAEARVGEVLVRVRDNGIGIDAEHLPHIFDMFSQASPLLAGSQGGLGIGLTLVRQLVELHGGTVEANSDGVGRGSEFIVHLPTADPPPPIPETSAKTEPSLPPCARRILIVDDNRDAADSLATMLRLMEHTTCVAYDGQEALKAAEAFLPEVALLDIGMPRMNGYEAARQMRKQPWGRGLTLIALTGWGQEADKRKALEAGFDHHLTKPVEIAALEKLLG